jgi:hypothetical protein
MALAMIYPEPEKLRRKGTGVSETERQGVSAARLSQARAVYRHSRTLAEAVLASGELYDATSSCIRPSSPTCSTGGAGGRPSPLRAWRGPLCDGAAAQEPAKPRQHSFLPPAAG